MKIENVRDGPNFQRLFIINSWIFPVLLSIVTFTSEYIDHHHEGPLLNNNEFLREAFIFSVLFPLLIGVIIYSLKNVVRDRELLSSEMNSLLILGQELSKVESWDNLLEPIGEYLNRIIPLQRICLGVHNPDLDTFQIVARAAGSESPNDDIDPDIINCLDDIDLDSSGQVRVINDSPRITRLSGPNTESYRYCLPMVFDDVVIAFLFFDVSALNNLSSNQIDMVSTIFPEISMAIAHIYSMEYYFDKTKSRQKERKKIARVLHDTLVQDISYLKLKLELLKEQDSLIGIIEVQRDLDRMQSVAQGAYEQVRGTLENLVSDVPQNISKALISMADSIYESSNIEVRVTENGTPQPLALTTRKKIINISREALSNIEKHSQSSAADIEITWCEKEFVLRITDYGIGFDPEHCEKSQHYGMTFMHDRAESIQANLDITSMLGKGTTTVLSLPMVPSVLVSK